MVAKKKVEKKVQTVKDFAKTRSEMWKRTALWNDLGFVVSGKYNPKKKGYDIFAVREVRKTGYTPRR